MTCWQSWHAVWHMLKNDWNSGWLVDKFDKPNDSKGQKQDIEREELCGWNGWLEIMFSKK